MVNTYTKRPDACPTCGADLPPGKTVEDPRVGINVALEEEIQRSKEGHASTAVAVLQKLKEDYSYEQKN